MDAQWRLPLPVHPRLRKICEALLAEPANNDTLELWADRLGASSRTVSRLFQRETGVAFAKWREHMRVCEAMCQLSTGTAPGDVASALGYADTATFASMFRRVLGVTPQGNTHLKQQRKSPAQERAGEAAEEEKRGKWKLALIHN